MYGTTMKKKERKYTTTRNVCRYEDEENDSVLMHLTIFIV